MKTQNILRSVFSVAVIAVLLLVVPCDAANPSALVGRWVAVSGKDRGDIMDLLSDGTGVLTKGSKGVAITWKTESGRFYITAFGTAQSANYKLQGSVLAFTKDNGEISEEYSKCKKDCEEIAKEYAKAAKQDVYNAAQAAAAAAAAEAAQAAAEAEIATKIKEITTKVKVKKGSFTDSRDNKTYKILKLNNQTWMAENLNYEADGSKCYNNEPKNCQKYGRLYNWKTAMKSCPSGWHLPSVEEWEVLWVAVGEEETIGSKILKATSGWESNGNGVDAVGFAALPGGYGDSNGKFHKVGYIGNLWANDIDDGMDIGEDFWYLSYNNKDVEYEPYLCSVRCVQD